MAHPFMTDSQVIQKIQEALGEGGNGGISTVQDDTLVVKFDKNYIKFYLDSPFESEVIQEPEPHTTELEIDLTGAILGANVQIYAKGLPIPFENDSFVNYKNKDNYDENKTNLIILDYKSSSDITAVIINDNVIDLTGLLDDRMSSLAIDLSPLEKQTIKDKLSITEGGGSGSAVKKERKEVPTLTYQLIESDTDKILEFTHVDGCTVTIPNGLPNNNRYEGKQMTTGNIYIETDTGVEVYTTNNESPHTSEEYSVFALDSVGNNKYLMYGRLHKNTVVPIPIAEIKENPDTEYQLENADKDKRINSTNNAVVTISIPEGLTVGNRYEGKQIGTGGIIFQGIGSVQIETPANMLAETEERYSVWGLDCEAENLYILYGNLKSQ